MTTFKNKRKLAAVTRETQEGHPWNGHSRNTSVPRINEEYITQLSEKVEGRVSKKLSQEFSRTESRILGALSKLDEFPLNPQIMTHSGPVPRIFRNTNVENQGTNEDDSQSDPHPEAGILRGRTTENSGPKDCRDMVTGATGEFRHCRDMVTGATEQNRNCRDSDKSDNVEHFLIFFPKKTSSTYYSGNVECNLDIRAKTVCWKSDVLQLEFVVFFPLLFFFRKTMFWTSTIMFCQTCWKILPAVESHEPKVKKYFINLNIVE